MAISQRTKTTFDNETSKNFAVGYCTLYGDMSGGFAVLKDVYKTQVYELAKYVNSLADVQFQNINKCPSAELR